MSSEIKRWDYDYLAGGPTEDADGDYVLYSDHEAEVARLRAEADALREENEFLRQMIRDANSNQDFDFDAAMGASA